MTQPVQRRRRLSKEIRQAELLDAAGDIFREKGYHLASTAEIAERAGVVEGTIYRYFTTKRDLLNTVVERAYEEAIADFEVQLEGIAGTWNRLRYLVWRHLKTIHDDPALARLVQYEIKTDPDYRSTSVFNLNRLYTRRTTEIIETAIRSGEFRPGIPVPVVRDMIYGCIDHHTWNYLRGEGTIDVNATADHITNLVYRGMAQSHHTEPGTSGTADGETPLANLGDALTRIEARLAQIEAKLSRQDT
jgi:AcrR family transcriptional regulator